MECPSNLFHGFVTHIIDPSNLWIHCGTDQDRKLYVDYQQQLDVFYNKNGSMYLCDNDSLLRGAYVVVADDVDVKMTDKCTACHWRRAQVAQCDRATENVDVFFIDLGYAAIVNRNQLRQALPQIFDLLPQKAVHVSLAHIKPLAKSWTSRAINFMEEKVLKKDVLVSFVIQDESSDNPALAIYTKESESLWCSLIHLMEQEELALITGCVIPQMSQETVDVYLQRMNELHYQYQSTQEEPVLSPEDSVGLEGRTLNNNAMPLPMSDDPQSMSLTIEEPSKDIVSHVDLDSLTQRTSFSISKLQEARQDEIKRQTRENISASINNEAADAISVSEDQDWDTVRDIDTHDDIQSQIYKGVQRQISDGELAEFQRELEQLTRGICSTIPKASDQESRSFDHCSEANENTEDIEMLNRSSPAVLISNEWKRLDNDGSEKDDTFTDEHNAKADREIEIFHMQKKIQEILADHDSKGADVVGASIHCIVEPDVDVSCEELGIVIYALLDHTVCKSIQEQEMALGILETYADTSSFVQAMYDVLIKLKDQYVKHAQSVRLEGKHKEFSKMLSLVFTFSSEWDERCAQSIQEFILTFVSNWIIFNKNHHQIGDHVLDTELMYIDCAETVLYELYNDLIEQFQETLASIMTDIRFKILHDSSPRRIRERLLDLLLNINNKGGILKQTTATINVSTQTSQINVTHSESQTSYSSVDSTSHHGHLLNNDMSITNTFMSSDKSMVFGGNDAVQNSIKSSQVSEFLPAVLNLPPGSSFSCKEDMPEVKDITSTNATYISCNESEDETKKQDLNKIPLFQPNSMSISPHTDFQSPSTSSEFVSRDSQPKKRGIPKSLRNLPSHLLRKCQDLPIPASTSQEEIISPQDTAKGPSSSPGKQYSFMDGDNMPIMSPDQLQGQEIEEVLEKSDAYSENNFEAIHRLFSENHQIDNDYSSPPHMLEKIGTETDDKFQEPSSISVENSVEPSASMNSVSDIFQSDCDNSFEVRHEAQGDHIPKVIISYSKLQLLEMNPDKDGPPLPLEDLWEPHELLEAMIVKKKDWHPRERRCSDKEKFSKRKMSPEQLDRLDGIVRKTSSNTEISETTEEINFSSNIENSQSQTFERETNLVRESTENLNDSDLLNLSDRLADTSTSSNKSRAKDSLKNIGENLLSSSKPPNIESKSENEFQTLDSEKEIWHEVSKDSMTCVSENSTQSNKGPGKKKKTKYRPLEFFIDKIRDEKHTDVDDGKIVDEFSPEALSMYEELEREEKEKEGLEAVGGQIPCVTKFGSTSLSAPKRPSLFAEAHKRYQTPKPSKPWCPGKRRCTRCGNEDHTVYDCPDDGSSLYK